MITKVGRFLAGLTTAILLAHGQGLPIAGVVLDPSGVGVPEALVLLVSGGERIAEQRTSIGGGFRFEGVAPGTYDVVVRREAFQENVTRVRAGSRAPAPLRVRLRLAQLMQEIAVDDGRNQINTQTSDNLDAPRIDREMLDLLPSMNNDPLSAIMRFVDLSALPEGGVDVVVDGMSGSAKAVSPSAIQEVRINQNPYSAEFNGHGNARIEIITAPGGTAYHGGLNTLFRNYRLDARPAFAAARPADHRYGFDGNLTGPLEKGKKSSFLISAESNRITNHPIVYARTLSGELRFNALSTVREDFVSARVSRQLSQRQQVSVRYEYSLGSARGAGTGGFVLPEAGANNSSGEQHLFFQHHALLSQHLVHDFQIRAGRRRIRSLSIYSDLPKIIVPGSFTGGGGQVDSLLTENHAQWTWTLSYSAGRHFIKTGVNSPELDRRAMVDRSNFAGTFTFSTLEDYRLARPFSFQQQQGEPRLVFWQKELGAFVEDEIRVRPGLSLSLGARWDWQNYFGDHNNLAPRMAVAWAPGRSRKTVLRGGAGVFSDRGQFRSFADTLRYDGSRMREVLLRDPTYPTPFAPGLLASQPPNISRFDSAIRTPYRVQYSLSAERQLPKATLAVTYRGGLGKKIYRSRDVNAPFPGFLDRPNPAIGVLRQFESSGSMRSDGLDVTVRTSAVKRFQGTMQYSLGRALNNTDGLYAFPANNWDLSREWAPHDEIRRHRFQMTGATKLPRIGDLGIVFQAASGSVFDLTTGRDDNHDGYARDRPPGVRRNSLVGPAFAELDLRWSRTTILDRKKKEKGPVLAYGVDGSNVINKLNPGQLIGNQSSPFFLQAVNSRAPRRMMLFLRFKF